LSKGVYLQGVTTVSLFRNSSNPFFNRQLEDLESADEFYGAMGRILAQIQEGILINDTSLMSVSNK
jgi:hypothetical protein